MNVNFLTNCYRPNFKAAFANDNDTKQNIKKLAEQNPNTLLAINLALKEISSDDKLAVKMLDSVKEKYAFENTSTGKKVVVRSYNIDEVLLNLCGNVNGLMSKFEPIFSKKAKLDPMSYLKVASYKLSKSVSDLSTEKDVIKSQIKDKKNELFCLEEKLRVMDKKIDQAKSNYVENNIDFNG